MFSREIIDWLSGSEGWEVVKLACGLDLKSAIYSLPVGWT